MHPRYHAATHPDKAAVIIAETGEMLSFRDLEEQANRFAHWLVARGAKPGDVIGLQLVNGLDTFPMIWGAQRCGVHYLMIPTALTEGEFDHIVRDSGARLIVRSPSAIERSAGWVPPADVSAVACDEAMLAGVARLPVAPIGDEYPGADMLYSSGTTGRPKGIKSPVPLSFDATTRAERIGQSHFSFSGQSVYLAPAPIYHAAPLRWSLAIHRHGGTVVLMQRFDAACALDAIDRYRVTVAQFVPTHFSRLLALTEEVRQKARLTSLRSVFHAGAPCPTSVKRAMIDWFGPIIHEFYSGTEGLGICVISSSEWLERPGSVGRAVEGIIRICGDDGEPVPAGTKGTIRFEQVAPAVYHNDPERSAAACNQYGWPTLGDIGHLDEEGYLTLADRADFMIITGGVNVYPQEVEDRLVEHPAVEDAAVVGLPDDDLGERVVALVQPTTWPCDEVALRGALDAHARALLAPAKRPRRWVFRPTLERSDTGKLAKSRLRARLMSEETAGGGAAS